MYAVLGKGLSLFGCDWLQSIRLDWHSNWVAYLGEPLQTLNAVVQEHVMVFRQELGQTIVQS